VKRSLGWLTVGLAPLAPACGVVTTRAAPGGNDVPSVFERTLASARRGDPDSQNLLGFMLFNGQGAMPDPTAARFWFGMAAEAGSPIAQLNLAVMHALGAGTDRDLGTAERFFRLGMANPARPGDLAPVSLTNLIDASCDETYVEPTPGSQIFGTFCAGCHGAVGLAEYRPAPSFALGERMEKSDRELLTSIEWGHQRMPEWSEKIPREWIAQALGHVRGLSTELRFGLLHRLRPLPERAFRFGPMDPELSTQRREPPVGVEGPLPAFADFCGGR